MNWRAIGCGTLALVAFLLIGAWGIWRATGPADCPDALPYEPAGYRPVGEVMDEPRLEGVSGELVAAGRVGFGLASWTVFVEPGRVPSASSEPLPQRIVLECGSGYQAFHRGT